MANQVLRGLQHTKTFRNPDLVAFIRSFTQSQLLCTMHGTFWNFLLNFGYMVYIDSSTPLVKLVYVYLYTGLSRKSPRSRLDFLFNK